MMVNCPKCGFSQPKDQYCANCGVDMIAFRPATKPLWQRIASNTAVQIVIVLAAVVTVFSYARHQLHRHLAERIAEIEYAKNTEIVSHPVAASASKSEFASASPASIPSEPPPTMGTPNADGPNANGHNVNGLNATADSASGASLGADNTATPRGSPSALDENGKPRVEGARGATTAATNLRVTFTEVQRSVIADLTAAADSRYPIANGPVFYGVLANVQAKIHAAQTDGRLKTIDNGSRSMEAGQIAGINSVQRDDSSGQMLGFDVETLPSQLTEVESHLQVRLLRYMREASGQVEEFSVPLPESFVIPHGSGVFVAGALPRRVPEVERHFYEPFKLLHILSTEEYRQGQTDLLIFIEPQ